MQATCYVSALLSIKWDENVALGGEPPGAEKQASNEARLVKGIEYAVGRIGFRFVGDDVVE